MIIDRLNYMNKDIPYYNGVIYEYDIQNAYPSILKYANFNFNDRTLKGDINTNIEKDRKTEILIRIGKEMRDNPEIASFINKNLKYYIMKFQSDNKLGIDNIFSIKKDALFVNKKCDTLNYDILDFREKNVYSLYFYDYISSFEYYINYKDGKYLYSIKGLGKVFDKTIYDNIVKIIYFTILNQDLSFVKYIQTIFMDSKRECIDYCPAEVLYRDFILIDKSNLKVEDYKYIDFKNIYFKYYFKPLKVLINYIL